MSSIVNYLVYYCLNFFRNRQALGVVSMESRWRRRRWGPRIPQTTGKEVLGSRGGGGFWEGVLSSIPNTLYVYVTNRIKYHIFSPFGFGFTQGTANKKFTRYISNNPPSTLGNLKTRHPGVSWNPCTTPENATREVPLVIN
jgi:hypothetical protein